LNGRFDAYSAKTTQSPAWISASTCDYQRLREFGWPGWFLRRNCRIQVTAESTVAGEKNRKKKSPIIDSSGCVVYDDPWLRARAPWERPEPVTLFVRCFLIALLVLAGPKWLGLVGDARASFRPVDLDRLEAATEPVSSTSSETTASESPTPIQPLKLELAHYFGAPSSSGMAGGSQITSHAPGATVGVVSEVPSPAIPFITRLRLANERVAAIPQPRSVFEPPRAAS
jgi:hypothetical protein